MVCGACGEANTINTPVDVTAENWVKCAHCTEVFRLDGHAGDPGEGALNPAASAVSNDDLLEAAVRRGLVTESQVVAVGTQDGQS